MCIKIRNNSIIFQGGRFGILSATSFLLTLTGSATGHEILLWSEEVSYLVTLMLVFVINFFGMRYFVYPQSSTKKITGQLMGFLIASFGFRAVEFTLFLILHTWMGIQYLLAIIMIMIISFVSKLIFYKFYIFD